MSFPVIFQRRKPDVDAMTRHKDIRGLIRLLRFHDTDIQIKAAKALGSLGTDATDQLISALSTKNKSVKLGIISALTAIKSPRSVQPLIAALNDGNSEVRWQAAIALGDLEDPAATGPLVAALRDPDKYVRYGAAISLTTIGWKPQGAEERAYYFAGLQEWGAISEIGKPAIPALTGLLHDSDSAVRIKAVELLGKTGDANATPALMQSLADENREVRWNTVLASPKCGISIKYLPRGLSRRPQNMKSPLIAGVLNFLLPGLGYGYLGKWWGTMIFQIDVMATVWLFKMEGDSTSCAILLLVYALLGIHAGYITTKIPKDPP